MKTKVLSLFNIALAISLLASLLLVGAIPSSGVGEYDPWADLDDDGDIDIYDIVDIAGRYGTTGTPINKTELLLGLQERVERLETGCVGRPAYDSGWVEVIGTPTVFFLEHNLNTTEVLVYVYLKTDGSAGTYYWPDTGKVYWQSLTNTTIGVFASYFGPSTRDYFRVLMWKIPAP